MKSLIILAIAFFAISVQAGTFKEVTMPDEETVEGKKLVLNGMGLREVNVMGIDINVYVGGLYLDKKTKNGDEVLASKSPKRMKMQFLRRVSEGDYRKTWKGIFKDRCDKACEKFEDKKEAFINLLKEVKKGDVVNFTFNSKGLEVEAAGVKWGRVESSELAQFILTSWLGSKPTDPALKSGILGSN